MATKLKYLLPQITLQEAQALIARAENAWRKADEKVGEAFARYDALFKKYKKLYVQERERHFVPIESPIRNNRVEYYVTDYYSAVYTLAAKTLEPREHKTAYKALQAAERAIEKAIDKREKLDDALDKCKKVMPKLEQIDRNWRELENIATQVMKNRKRISA